MAQLVSQQGCPTHLPLTRASPVDEHKRLLPWRGVALIDGVEQVVGQGVGLSKGFILIDDRHLQRHDSEIFPNITLKNPAVFLQRP
jgi:hypothetical protein